MVQVLMGDINKTTNNVSIPDKIDGLEYDFVMPDPNSSTTTNYVEEWRRVMPLPDVDPDLETRSSYSSTSSVLFKDILEDVNVAENMPPDPQLGSGILGSSATTPLYNSIATVEAFQSIGSLKSIATTHASKAKPHRKLSMPFSVRSFAFVLVPLLAIALARFGGVPFPSLCRFSMLQNNQICGPPPLIVKAGEEWKTHGDVDYAQRLFTVQMKTFDAAFTATNEASEMSVELLGAQMAITDLATAIQTSDLPRKDQLKTLITKVAQSTGKASNSLKKYVWETNKATDIISAATEEAKYLIDRAATGEKRPINRIMNAIALRSGAAPIKAIIASYEYVTGALNTQLTRLRFLNQKVSEDLAHIDRDLNNLRSLAHYEEKRITWEEEEEKGILEELWTILGLNKAGKDKFSKNLGLLKKLEKRRRDAVMQIKAADYVLEIESSELESLREVISQFAEDTPIERHIQHVNAALRRISESRRKENRYDQVYDKLVDAQDKSGYLE